MATCAQCKESFKENWSLSIIDRNTDLPTYFCGDVCLKAWHNNNQQQYGIRNIGGMANHRRKR